MTVNDKMALRKMLYNFGFDYPKGVKNQKYFYKSLKLKHTKDLCNIIMSVENSLEIGIEL